MSIRHIQTVASDAERDAIPKSLLNTTAIYNRANDRIEVYDPDLGAFQTLPTDRLADQIRPRYTANQIATATLNAADQTLVAAPGAGYQLRLVDFRMTAIGGNAATATSVRLKGTQATSLVNLVTVAVAALTRSTAVEPGSANVTLLADGAWRGLLDANTALVADVDNDNLATATAILFETWHLVIPS